VKTKPFRYQSKGAYLLKRRKGRCLLADEMGLGKSIQSLMYGIRAGLFPIIIVCPASLKWNWENEVSTHFGLHSVILEGRKPPRINRRLTSPDIIIINYDILINWVPWLLSLNPCLLIFDEAHYCSNPSAKRTRAVKKLAKSIKHVIGLTGTPLINRPSELWPVLQIIRPDIYKKFRPFADKYCAPRLTKWGWEYKGARNLPMLHQELRDNLMVRRLKSQVLKELPKNRQIILPVDLSRMKEYKKAEHDFIEWVGREKGLAKARKAKKAEELSKTSYLKQLAAELKMTAIVEWIQNFLDSSDSKLIVFGVHHNVLEPLFNKFRRQSVLINGKTPTKKRRRYVKMIQTDPKTRIIFGNMRAAGVGLNLTKPDTTLFTEIPWTPVDINQCIARSVRIGQEKETTAYFMVARNTIEERLWSIVQRKQSTFDAAIDGKDVKLTKSIYDDLIKEYYDAADQRPVKKSRHTNKRRRPARPRRLGSV